MTDQPLKTVTVTQTSQMSQIQIDAELINAAEKGNIEDVRFWLQQGANPDPDLRYYKLESALMIAVKHGHTEIINVLLQAGAKADTSNVYEETALLIALKNADFESVRKLHAAGANPSGVQKKERCNPLLFALTDAQHAKRNRYSQWQGLYPQFEAATLLAELGADLNFSISDGSTPLILVAGMKCTPENTPKILALVKLMVEKGANIHAKNKKGENALERARARLNKPVADFLEQYINDHPQPVRARLGGMFGRTKPAPALEPPLTF